MVVDNFINKKQLKEIKKEMLHGNFNWFYCQKSLDYDKKNATNVSTYFFK